MLTEAKNVNVSSIYLDLHSAAMVQLVSNKYFSWVLYVGFRMKKHRLLKCFAFLKTVNLLFFFYELVIGPQPTFLECIVIFL